MGGSDKYSVHQSMSVLWAFTLSHFVSQICLRDFFRLLAIGMCHFLPVHHFGMSCLAWSKVTIQHNFRQAFPLYLLLVSLSCIHIAVSTRLLVGKKWVLFLSVWSDFHMTDSLSIPGGARGVMVIFVGNGHGDSSSNPGRG